MRRFLWNYKLSEEQLQGLKTHVYRCEGTSFIEPVLQVFWRWLVTKVPFWMAPNLLTGLGFIINLATSLPLLLLDTNLGGVAPSWVYLIAAVGFFIYQSLDAIDGKQARRTGSANQLGELFDHGCDAINMFFILIAGASSVGLHDNPISLLTFVVLLNQINFVYHWQTFVSGTLRFNLFDVTEGELTTIGLLVVRGLFGLEFWNIEVPVVNIQLKMMLVTVVLSFSFLNLFQPFYNIILTEGAGKNGTTVANTSVLSPMATVIISTPVSFIYYSLSPTPYLHHCLLFAAFISLPTVKATITIILSGMTKTPYPLVDRLHLLPWLAILNLCIGTPLPQLPLLLLLTIFEVLDIILLCVTVCLQVADFLKVPIFTLPTSVSMTTSK